MSNTDRKAATMLREAEQELIRDCRDFAVAAGVTPEPCVTRKPTPAEALELKIKLPWAGKVQLASTDTLTKQLFLALENYGLTRGEIAELFCTYGGKLVAMLDAWGIPKGKPCVQNKAARDANMERPAFDKRKPGQSRQQATDAAVKTDPDPDQVPDLDAELAQVDQQLAAMGYGEADQAAPATREQVEEFFNDAAPASGGLVTEPMVALVGDTAPGQEIATPLLRSKNVEIVQKDGKAVLMATAAALRGQARSVIINTVNVPTADGDPARLSPEAIKESMARAMAAADQVADPATDAPPSGLAADQHHYNAAGDFQPIEVMQASMPPEQFIGFLRGNVIKYTMRAGRKDDMRREIDKVIQYATWWRQAVDGKIIDPREVAK